MSDNLDNVQYKLRIALHVALYRMTADEVRSYTEDVIQRHLRMVERAPAQCPPF